MAFIASGLPIDWTNGAGTFPASTISIPANPNRKWLYIQNIDTTAVTVGLAGVEATDMKTAATPAIPLAPAASAGAAGGVLERTLFNFVPLGAVTITGTNGKQIVALEG